MSRNNANRKGCRVIRNGSFRGPAASSGKGTVGAGGLNFQFAPRIVPRTKNQELNADIYLFAQHAFDEFPTRLADVALRQS